MGIAAARGDTFKLIRKLDGLVPGDRVLSMAPLAALQARAERPAARTGLRRLIRPPARTR